jgi:hypothetical protein
VEELTLIEPVGEKKLRSGCPVSSWMGQ